jgi:hypothetical protein
MYSPVSKRTAEWESKHWHTNLRPAVQQPGLSLKYLENVKKYDDHPAAAQLLDDAVARDGLTALWVGT